MGDTKRVVILGRSSSGKTSIINCLRDQGYQVGHEIATVVLDSRKTRKVNEKECEERLAKEDTKYTIQERLLLKMLKAKEQETFSKDEIIAMIKKLDRCILNDNNVVIQVRGMGERWEM